MRGAITASDSVVDTPPDAIHDGQQVRVTQVLHPQDDAKGKPHG